MRGVALLAGSLGLHVAALAALPSIFPATPVTPLFVDLATLDQAAIGPGGEGGAGPKSGTGGAAGRTDDATAHAQRPAPAARARTAEPPPVEAPRAVAALRAPAPSSPPAPAPGPTSSAPPSAPAPAPIAPPVAAPAPAPSPPPAAISTPSVETPPARPPLATPPAAAPRESGQVSSPGVDADRPTPIGPRDAGRGARTDLPGDGGGTVSGSGGSSLALARPGAGPGAGGSVPPEYGAYLARFRQRVEEALVYPLAARRQGRGGRVELDVLLEPSGRVTRVDVVTSSASAALDAAAVDAVKTVEAIPFPVELARRPLLVRIPLVFQLR